MSATGSKRAVLYLRISQDRTGQETGVSRQQDDCTDLAEREGYEVVEVYRDNDVSASSKKPRPEFERMMRSAQAGEFDAIIVWSTDRLYRKITDLERIVSLLAGVSVHAVKSGRIDLSTADGRGHARLLASVAQMEAEKLGERVSARARQRATVERRSTSGRRPFGWNLDGTPNPAEAAAVADAFGMLLEGVSVSGIARELSSRGLQSSEGGPITQPRVSAWLRNPRHAGIVLYKGKPVAQAEGIIDRATWDRAQALLSDPARAPKKGRPHSTLLGGLLSCPVCGETLKAASNSLNRGERILTYSCEPDRHVNQSRERIDGMVRELLAAYVEQNAQLITDSMEAADGAAPIRARIEDLKAQLKALPLLLAAGKLHSDDFAAAATAARAEIDALEEQAAEASDLSATSRAIASGEDIRSMDRERLRAIFSELIASATVRPQGTGLDIEWRL